MAVTTKSKTGIWFYALLWALVLGSCSDVDVERVYYPDGQLNIEEHRLNGKKHGMRTVYYPDGKINWEINFINDKENGIYRKYYPNGHIQTLAFYKNGKQNGISTQYLENGIIESMFYFKNGKYDGLALYNFSSGKINQHALFEHDTTVFYHIFDESGKLIKDYHQISIEPLAGDTIYAGESYKAKVLTKGPLNHPGLTFQCFFITSKVAPKHEYVNVRPKNEVLFEQVNMPAGEYTLLAEIIRNHVLISRAEKKVVVLPR